MTEETKKEKLFAVNNELLPSISNEEFDSLTFDSSIPALVLFGAERCKVCKELHPILNEIIPDYVGKLISYYVDVDEQKDLRTRFRLRGIPTLLLFKDGEVQERIAGMLSAEELIEKINEHLN